MTGITDKVLVLCIIPLILYVSLLPVMPLMEPDESRYSLIPRSMNESGDYITPRLKEVVYIEKPPLAYWATALSFKLFGENEFSSRLFAALCAWGCILLVYRMGNAFDGYPAGLYAAAVLTTSLFHFSIGRMNILDMPVALFVSLAIWAGYRRFTGANRPGWIYLFYFFSGLAFLTKGLIGIVFPLAIIVPWLIFMKRWREIFHLFSPPGIIILLILILPWIVLVQEAHSDFLRFFFIQEHLQRYTTTIHHRNQPFYFYMPVLIAGTIPWCSFLYRALKGQRYLGRKESGVRKEDASFLLLWIGIIILFFSLSRSKLIPYIAPVFLPLSLYGGRVFRRYDLRPSSPGEEKIFGLSNWPVVVQSLLFILVFIGAPFVEKDFPARNWWLWISAPIAMQISLVVLPDYVRKRTGGNWFIMVYGITALFLASILFPLSYFLTPYKSAYPLAQAIKQYVPAGFELYQYDMSLYGIDFYDKMRTPIVDDSGEVRYGSEFLPPAERLHYFLNSEEFFTLCRNRSVIYCATKSAERVERLRKSVSHLTLLWDNKYYYLLRLENREKMR